MIDTRETSYFSHPLEGTHFAIAPRLSDILLSDILLIFSWGATVAHAHTIAKSKLAATRNCSALSAATFTTPAASEQEAEDKGNGEDGNDGKGVTATQKKSIANDNQVAVNNGRVVQSAASSSKSKPRVKKKAKGKDNERNNDRGGTATKNDSRESVHQVAGDNGSDGAIAAKNTNATNTGKKTVVSFVIPALHLQAAERLTKSERSRNRETGRRILRTYIKLFLDSESAGSKVSHVHGLEQYRHVSLFAHKSSMRPLTPIGLRQDKLRL